jgi:hypothetical protein
MRRWHLVEIMDQKWCPDHVRDGITDYLRWFEHFWNIYEPIFPRLKQVLGELRSERIIDFCSGGGGPWVNLYREFDDLKEFAPMVYLTDLYPNGSAFGVSRSISSGRIHFYSEPVSATNVPAHLTGFRTLFSAFHHFPPQMAKSILHDAVRNNQGIAIFEITRRNFIVILTMCFSPLLVICTTPFVKPFRWWRLFWTYIVPAIPFAFMFDSIVSCLRTYSPRELEELTEGIADGLYHWEVGIEPPGHPAGGITYLIGYPFPEKDALKHYEAGQPLAAGIN